MTVLSDGAPDVFGLDPLRAGVLGHAGVEPFHVLERRVLLTLHGEGECSFADLFRAADTTSKNHFQRSLTRLQHHILIDRRLEAAGKRYWSHYKLTKRGQRFAETFIELAEGLPTTRGLGQAVREELLAAPAA